MVKVAPSILSLDVNEISEKVEKVKNAGADYIHLDVMDGKFVNNETCALEMLEQVRDISNITIDTHLMVEDPENWLEDFLCSSIISFHIEAVDNETLDRIVEYLHERDIKVGVAIKPDTQIEEIMTCIEKIDMVLVMLVEPGFGGQTMIEKCLEKVTQLRKIAPELDIEVDGGINLENVQRVKEAGANIIVAGTAIFGAEDIESAIQKIKE